MPTCKLSSAIQCKKYFIHHPLVKNIPYLIYINKKKVSIYKKIGILNLRWCKS